MVERHVESPASQQMSVVLVGTSLFVLADQSVFF